MCSSAGDIEDITSLPRDFQNKINKIFIYKCKKCGEKSSVLLQGKDPFCNSCFFEYCNHKFRSTIGKSKKIKHGEKVLLSCSGGRKSAALLHMTKQTLKSASLKQISFSPGILFIDDSFLMPVISENVELSNICILKELKKSEYPVLYSSLEMVYNINKGENLYTSVSNDCLSNSFSVNHELRSKMKENFKDISLSSKIDLLEHLRLLLITEIGSQAGYDCVFVGDTASALAVKLLSDIALGRGSQISSDTSFYETKFKVPVCRPLREFLNKEVALYNHLHHTSYTVFPNYLTKTSSNSSIQRLTEAFLSNLQENFPATIFTVFRTGGKLSKVNMNLDSTICIICKSELDNRNLDACSALEALKISEKLSVGSSYKIGNKSNSKEIMQFLCHGCSIIFKNMSKEENFHSFIPVVSHTRMDRNEMKEEINDFLLEDDDYI